MSSFKALNQEFNKFFMKKSIDHLIIWVFFYGKGACFFFVQKNDLKNFEKVCSTNQVKDHKIGVYKEVEVTNLFIVNQFINFVLCRIVLKNFDSTNSHHWILLFD